MTIRWIDKSVSSTETAIYLSWRKDPSVTAYNLPFLLELPEETDYDSLSEAIVQVFRAHPALLSRFGPDKNGNLARKMPEKPAEADVIIQRKKGEPDISELIRPFDMEGDLYRLSIFEGNEKSYLFLDLHHINCDRTSFGLLIREIDRVYSGKEPVGESMSPEQYAQKEQEARLSADFQSAEAWYDSLLEGEEINSTLFHDKETGEKKVTVLSYPLQIDKDELSSFVKKTGIRTGSFFTGVYGYFLSRCCGAKESLYATVYSGRNAENADTIGMFVKTLPILQRFKGNENIVDHLKSLDDQIAKSRENSLFSYLDIQSKYNLSIPTMFVYQGDTEKPIDFLKSTVSLDLIESDDPKNEILCSIYRKETGYELRVSYRTDLFEPETIEMFAQSYEQTAKEFMTKECLNEVSLVSEAQLQRMDAYQADVFEKAEVNYITKFRKAAELYSERTAVVFKDESLTYAQLDDISERVAGYLKSQGIGKEDIVSILVNRSMFMTIASLGVLKAGAAYQPLDATYPAERLLFMIEDASCKLLIVDEDLRDIVSDYKGPILYTKDIAGLPACEKTKEDPSAKDLFVLLYTSGSTGTPKGTMLEHGNICSMVDWYTAYFKMDENAHVAAYASFGFDANMSDTYPVLSVGGCLYIVEEEIRLNLPAIEEHFQKWGITHALLTTQVGRQFYMMAEVPSLKHLLCGGEKLVPVEPKNNGTILYNAYGPSECTVLCTCQPVDRLYERIPIGRALTNCKLYIIDENMHRLPPIVPGELMIAGLDVARGYLNRPEKTAEVFIMNPFTDMSGYERAYRTGDVVRELPDGRYDFIGRNDSQVKIRGFRIELTEVEGVIREYPGITDACTKAWDMGEGGKIIAAYIVSDKSVDIDDLKNFILERKPPYIVPASIIQLDSIPLTQNYKVNYRALPEPVFTTQEPEEGKGKDNVLEEALKKAISEISGNSYVPYETPLEYAGLTSIGMIRLSAFVYKTYGIIIPMEAFRGMSLIDLENEIIKAWMEGPKKDEAENQETGIHPLGAAQLGVYMDCVKNPESTAYNIGQVLEFEKNIDPNQLASAVKEIIEAHPALNVHYETIDSKVMTVPNEADIEVPIRTVSEAELEAYRNEFIMPFILRKGPLYKAEVIESEKAVYLFADFHHLVFDGYSETLFLNDLADALSGRKCEKESSSFEAFIREKNELIEKEEENKYEPYFQSLFENYDSPSGIAPDKQKSDSPGKSGIVRSVLPQDVIKRAISRTGVTEAVFFLSAVYYVTARLTGSDHVYISTISSGRSDVRFSNTYGMFVNTLPIASSLTDGSVDEYITKTAADFDAAIDHEFYPFAKIASKWDYSVELMYGYQRDIVSLPDIPGLKKMNLDESDAQKFPMYIRIVDQDGSPAFEMEYNDALYTEEFANRILKYCRNVALSFAENGNARLRSISLMDEQEKEIVAGFNTIAESVEVPEDVLFFTRMEEQARLHPERTALIACDGTFTYKEFDENANRVANALIKLGAAPKGKVLILLPRCAKALFAFFGASKAGLGYIPFDPEYPEERINLVIEDSEAQFVITTKDLLPRFEGKCAVDIEDLLDQTDTSKPDVSISQDDISYMIYTSGSTGRPKGVVLTHRGMAHYTADMPGKEMVNSIREYCSVYCSITTLSFDISVMEYSLALSLGLTLYFADKTECNNADLLAKRMIETKADVISGTPSRIYTLLSSEAFCDALRQNGKLVICGGEKFTEPLFNKLMELGVHPMNIYGPSEITISCNEHDLIDDDVITIGRPTPGVTEYIVDTDGNELPIGVVGEIWIGGWGVGRGYNNLPEMTADKFINYRGERIYKSGDYARWLENGYIEVLGRKDNQIKLRGLRIELGEVEAVLSKQPGMKHAAVKIEKINGIEHLCAWFTNENPVDIQQLKEAMGKTLTAYMVPSAYMQMEKMPFTPNGKLDLKNLPVPEVFREKGDGARTKTEKDFCEIFSKILNVDNVLATEDFFALGGTSLLVTEVIIEAGKRGYTIVFADVFSNPTPRALSAMFEEEKTEVSKDVEIEDYDYTAINELLKSNTIENFRSGEKVSLGNVLLTGATGYLGIHILYELLENTDSTIYCLVRAGRKGPESRLKGLLMYYFENPYQELFGNRILPVEGDITDAEQLMSLDYLPIDTVINCAASVKHFAHDSAISDINVGGAKNVIEYCLKKNAMMIQTSTMSVIEMGFVDIHPETVHPSEKTLYFGQDLTNQYVRSKFLAERSVLEAVATRGLKAKIMRYGNLSARFRDGEFQINFESNSAMGGLRAYCAVGAAPYDILDDSMEFSPIDLVAKATVLLASGPHTCTVYHVITDQYIQMVHVFDEMNVMGHSIRYTERPEFETGFKEAQSDPNKASLLTSLMAYMVSSKDRERRILSMNREFTLQALYRLGFTWPMTSWDYFRRFMEVLNGLGYFDDASES